MTHRVKRESIPPQDEKVGSPSKGGLPQPHTQTAYVAHRHEEYRHDISLKHWPLAPVLTTVYTHCTCVLLHLIINIGMDWIFIPTQVSPTKTDGSSNSQMVDHLTRGTTVYPRNTRHTKTIIFGSEIYWMQSTNKQKTLQEACKYDYMRIMEINQSTRTDMNFLRLNHEEPQSIHKFTQFLIWLLMYQTE